MRICGLQKLTALDYPGKLAMTIFTGGCNLRCPFCHNAPLVTQLDVSPDLSRQEVMDLLKSRKNLLKGVVFSGGEPLLQPDLMDWLKAVRELGFSIKLDTNGCFPDVLAQILDLDLSDYVAMDIKNCLERYSETVGILEFDTGPIEESVRILQASKIAFEFRTTLVREFHDAKSLLSIGQWLKNSPRYFLQQFVDSGNLVGNQVLQAFSPDEMRKFLELIQPYFQAVELRGIE